MTGKRGANIGMGRKREATDGTSILPLIADLSRARIRSGITQEVMAERLGVTASTISKWERGASAFPLAKALSYINEVGWKFTAEGKS